MPINTAINQKSMKSFGEIVQEMHNGHFLSETIDSYYTHSNGCLWHGDSLIWLSSIPSESIDVVFADPPYNIRKASWDKFKNTATYIDWSMDWITEAHRVLKPNGTLYICGFSEIIAEMVSPCLKYFTGLKWLIWHYKNKANLGNDWGRSHESILHFRKGKEFIFNIDSIRTPYHNHTLKYPEHPQANSSNFANGKAHQWNPHPEGAKPKDVIEIPTTCNGMNEKTPHPTQKPEELLRKLILASSNPGDIIIDPFIGSGTTAVCAEQLQRRWMGCDANKDYLLWAKDRIEKVSAWTIEEWIEYDKKNLRRRMSIR